MKEKKSNLKITILVYLVILMVLAIWAQDSLFIGKCQGTEHVTVKLAFIGRNAAPGQFTMRIQKPEFVMQENIVMSIRPDEFIPDANVRRVDSGGPILDPARFTNNNQAIYNFFNRIFKADSPLNFMGQDSTILNYRMWRSILFVNLLFIFLALYLRKKLLFIPTKPQIIVEMIYSFIRDLCVDVLGKHNLKFVPYFLTLFMFIFVSNWVGLLPIPGIVEPTRHLNVTLGLGVMSLSIVHFNAIRKKGIGGYLKGYCEPMFILAPINLVGELAKVVSISFRLFGNIFGGAIIFAVVASLTQYVIVPIGLNLFFVMFAGTLQAFVFTMLSMTYLALEITD